MATPETRVIVNVPSYREVMEEVKVEVLKLVGEKVLEFQEEQFYAWFGSHGRGKEMPEALCYAPNVVEAPVLRGGGKRERLFSTRYGKVESAVL